MVVLTVIAVTRMVMITLMAKMIALVDISCDDGDIDDGHQLVMMMTLMMDIN